MTIQEILSEGKRLLGAPCPGAVIDTPALDAALLLAETLHLSREELLVRGNEIAAEPERQKYNSLLERRRSGECIAYILGRREFRGIEFTVNPGVLVPRPDTETLVEAALEYIDLWQGERSDTSARGAAQGGLSLLDLCTGSGAVAISIKNERPHIRVTASDVSPETLQTATLNAARLLEGRQNAVQFIQSDLFNNIPEKFDIIVSNPPYIPTGEIDTLSPEVRREPRLALDGGRDGLDLIRKIVSQAPEHLSPGGILLLEASPEQMPAIKTLLEKEHFNKIKIHKDLAGKDRVISAHL